MKRIAIKKYLIICLLCLLTGCGMPAAQTQAPPETGFLPAIPGNYDSTDTAVLVKKNTADMKLTFLNLELGKRYTLNYDGATTYADKYGQAVSLAQLAEGTMVDVTFMHEKKRLNSMQASAEAFQFSDVTDFVMEGGSRIALQGEYYTLDQEAVVLTPDGPGEVTDINAADRLTVSGIGHTIYSLRVDRGHGYLRLENASYFVGGWIQIGDRIVQQITSDMLLAVPEGSYTVLVSNKGSAGSADITVARNQEVSVDASGWISTPQFGKVVFTVSPENAKVYIDGEVINAAKPQELSYGIHQMVATAEGYDTVSRYIRVAEDKANLNIVLEYNGSTVSDNEAQTTLGEAAALGPVSENAVSENQTTLGDDAAYTVSGNGLPGNLPMVPALTATPTPVYPTAVPMYPTATPTPASAAAYATATPTPASTATPTPAGNPNTAQPSSVSANDVVSTDGYRVYVDAPSGVEVYKNGSYIGISPVSFPKKEGLYTITLRRDGYQTRSYTIDIDGDKNNVNYSFSELVEIR
ncbi:MAG: PEGA domain-containing protein [Lachnospiraceae bacterium]|nr:PEGA domain-containing protein [Lachnospiraceae bacterium]